MIRLSDALILSVTKLKTRRVRLVITTLVSGLFFVLLALSSLIFNGVTRSVEDFSQDGFGKRYITQVGLFGGEAEYGYFEDKDIIAKAKELDKQLVDAKKAEAKRLGITYDPALEQLSVMTGGGQNGNTDYLQPTRQVAGLIEEYRINAYKGFFEELRKVQSEYDVRAVHDAVILSGGFGDPSQSATPILSIIKDGKEADLAQNSFGTRGFDSITQGLTALDDDVIEAFVIDDQPLGVDESGQVPIVAPYSAAEEALGFTRLSPTASAEQKLERLREIRAKAVGTTFQVCLRNQTSVDRQNTAKQQQEEYQKNKDKKDYRRPDLMFDVSGTPCSDVVVTRDVRNASTKNYDAKQQQFDEKFGKEPALQRILTFRIIGVTPDPPSFEDAFSVRSIVTSIVSSNLGSGWFVPLSAQASLPEYTSVFNSIGKFASYQNQILVEFNDAETAKQFVKEKSCEPNFFADPSQVQKECDEKGTPFFISSYGSNSVAIEDAREWFDNFYIKASLVVAAISAFIMMGTVGKVIADSRRETAVFRAIGAKRADIALVYVLYSLLLGAIIVLFAIGAGFLLAQWVDNKYSTDVTIDALTTFNSQDLQRQFSLIGLNAQQLLILAGIIISAAVASTILPLINNLKRNPIKDMRDER